MPPETDNLALEELYQEDQKDRARVYTSPEAVRGLQERDAARLKRVRSMAEGGQVRTKNDLFHAGVMFYHGRSPGDFLCAHRFASLSALMGHGKARWLMAASLDRHLTSVGLGQVYGTQFEYNRREGSYELKLPVADAPILDFEKDFLGVPPIAQRLDALNGPLKESGDAKKSSSAKSRKRFL